MLWHQNSHDESLNIRDKKNKKNQEIYLFVRNFTLRQRQIWQVCIYMYARISSHILQSFNKYKHLKLCFYVFYTFKTTCFI